MTTRRRQRAQLRQEIVAAARDILARDGYSGLSMRKVAEAVAYSPTAIYRHFEDTRALVSAVHAETFEKLLGDLSAEEADPKDPVLRFGDLMRRYVAFGIRHPQHYLATFVAISPDAAGAATLDVSDGAQTREMLHAFSAAIQACIESGAFRSATPEVAARSTWAALHGVTALLIQIPDFDWGDQKGVIESLIDTMIDGLRLRRRPARLSPRIPARPSRPINPPIST
ncbi:MAG: TetR/AcrR family transcriptional regulator [Acidobacteria bacterium]|nr:TetR/AcrR family transcriptional regulator [Acidobacteriota bacterium]